MALTFANTHNMIAYLTKSDASDSFERMLLECQYDSDNIDAVDDVTDDVANVADVADANAEPTPPSSTPAITPPPS
nr:hypothetical protein [Tanacetum cinerariifolium]